MVERARESGGDVHVDAEGGADQLVGVGALKGKQKQNCVRNIERQTYYREEVVVKGNKGK